MFGYRNVVMLENVNTELKLSKLCVLSKNCLIFFIIIESGFVQRERLHWILTFVSLVSRCLHRANVECKQRKKYRQFTDNRIGIKHKFIITLFGTPSLYYEYLVSTAAATIDTVDKYVDEFTFWKKKNEIITSWYGELF